MDAATQDSKYRRLLANGISGRSKLRLFVGIGGDDFTATTRIG